MLAVGHLGAGVSTSLQQGKVLSLLFHTLSTVEKVLARGSVKFHSRRACLAASQIELHLWIWGEDRRHEPSL